MSHELIDALAACDRRIRRMQRVMVVQMIALVLLVSLVFASCATTAVPAAVSSAAGPLRVTELVVVDPNGVERVRIGGELPDAIVGGQRVGRGGEKIAGVLLYDGTGQERGGYVTFEPSGNVGLTLDTRRGQVTFFVAGPDSGSALQMWHGNDAIELRSDAEGSRFTAIKNREVVYQQPPVASMTASTCEAYREGLSRFSLEQVERECRRRFAAGACDACLR
jgi:hypothetical protein